MAYVDGFVLAVPTANKEQYRKACVAYSEIMKTYGAVTTVDTWGDDVPEGKVTSFPMSVQRKPDETVCFGYTIWPSKSVRDEAKSKAMEDPRMRDMDMPFDGKRMIYGGFEVLHES